jgi:hypothetical protein
MENAMEERETRDRAVANGPQPATSATTGSGAK